MAPDDRRRAGRRRTGKDPAAPATDRRRAARRRSQDRRKSQRIPVAIWVEEKEGANSYLRRTSNLSEDGIFFDVALPSPVGTQVVLKFTLPGDARQVVASGTVANVGTSGDHLGMGVAFTRIEGDGKRRIREFIRSDH